MLKEAKYTFGYGADEKVAMECAEVQQFIASEPQTFTDIDISVNTPATLTFNKRPWSEFIIGTTLILIPILAYFCLDLRKGGLK